MTAAAPGYCAIDFGTSNSAIAIAAPGVAPAAMRLVELAPGIVVDEEHRPAEHHPADRDAGLGLGPAPQVRQVGGDDIEVADGAAAADVGGLLDQRAAEDAFHRAHEAALDAVDIGGDRSAAEFARRRVGTPAPLAFAGIEDRRRHSREAQLELDQAHRRARGHRHRRVRGAEVDRAEGGVRHARRRSSGEGARF